MSLEDRFYYFYILNYRVVSYILCLPLLDLRKYRSLNATM